MARKKKGEPVHGWLILDKPEGVTSTQAVGICRRIYNAQKCGHGGFVFKNKLHIQHTHMGAKRFGQAGKILGRGDKL